MVNSIHRYNMVVVGGGIVGMATSMAMCEKVSLSLAVLEAEDRLAAHQTGNNSGVIHSGLYYKPGSLKARNCVEGRKALYNFCREHHIPYEQCGKVVVAAQECQIPALETLEQRGRANGLQGLRRLTQDEIQEYEPHARGKAGLWVPETGIVDFIQVAEAYALRVQEKGGEVLKKARLIGCHPEPGGLLLETTQGRIRCEYLINCAGLQSDRVASMCGLKPKLRIIPFRGEYYKLAPHAHSLVSNLIYPVPDPEFPFLGVHFTRMIRGGVEAGPNAVLAFKREGYRPWSFSLKDSFEMLSYPGFWWMVSKYWKTGLGEFYRSLNKRSFVKSLQILVPDLGLKDLERGGAGVRAQAVEENGLLTDDFRIVETDRMIHVLNAPSPAATASISIGKTVADLACKDFKLC